MELQRELAIYVYKEEPRYNEVAGTRDEFVTSGHVGACGGCSGNSIANFVKPVFVTPRSDVPQPLSHSTLNQLQNFRNTERVSPPHYCFLFLSSSQNNSWESTPHSRESHFAILRTTRSRFNHHYNSCHGGVRFPPGPALNFRHPFYYPLQDLSFSFLPRNESRKQYIDHAVAIGGTMIIGRWSNVSSTDW